MQILIKELPSINKIGRSVSEVADLIAGSLNLAVVIIIPLSPFFIMPRCLSITSTLIEELGLYLLAWTLYFTESPFVSIIPYLTHSKSIPPSFVLLVTFTSSKPNFSKKGFKNSSNSKPVLKLS